jgi:putative colanic acid biosynthesis acetyltransferase WcaF
MRLDLFSNEGFDRGASFAKELLWLAAGQILLSSWIPGSGWRVWLLRAFGATIGGGVTIKPAVRVKFPWRLRIGNHCWIGERVWIDNLGMVCIGDHVCVSQDAYLCTGSHDWSREAFDLIVRPITIESHAWICARASIAPGATIGSGAVVGFASVGHGPLAEWTVYSGNPAQPIRQRVVIATDASNDARIVSASKQWDEP